LSPAFAVESLTVNIIEELRERLESTDDYTKQLGLITEMEEKYNLEEGILLSQYYLHLYLHTTTTFLFMEERLEY
jgi:hypothetical protein